MSKIKKIVCCFVVLLLVFSIFSLNVFSAEISPVLNFGSLYAESIGITYTTLDGTDRLTYTVTPEYVGTQTIDGKQVEILRIRQTNGVDFYANYYKVSIEIKTQSYVENAPYFMGSYSVGIPSAQGLMEKTKYNEPLPEPILFRTPVPRQNASYKYLHLPNIEGLKITYGKNDLGKNYTLYVTTFWFVSSGGEYFDFYLFDNDMTTYSENEIAQQIEKEEASTQGEDSINQVTGVIEDKSGGFINALGGLVSSMSYDGTKCAWTFPSLKLPAIDGVMPEYVLTEEKPIDFEYWVNKIPQNILTLVRAICTIALIVFCFKELYGTISYVLTLKGGGNSE